MTKENKKIPPKEVIAETIQELTQQLIELNLSLKKTKYVTDVKGQDDLISAMKDTKRLLKIESKSGWFLEGMKPVDPEIMKASAEKYNAGIEKRRIEHNRAQIASEKAIKRYGLTD